MDPESLAKRLAAYAASPLLQDHPEIRQDLQAASELATDYQALLDTWDAFFKQKFVESLAAAPIPEWWKRRLEFRLVVNDAPLVPEPEEKPAK